MSYTIPKSLLSVDTNAKTIKGVKYGFMTAILYMAPSNLSGYQVCPMAAIAGCESACLNTAGLGGVYVSIQMARINRVKYFMENREGFMLQIAQEIETLKAKAATIGYTLIVRLNGTSDIKWENIGFCGFDNIMELHDDITFYDYTKIANRVNLPGNYDLTFSYSGVLKYQKYVNIAIKNKMRIAVVFRTRKNIPNTFLGLQCIDGDDSDVRHIEPQNTVVALYAKGKARSDMTGFVVDSAYRSIPLFA